jgi:hypothetical protein
MKEPGSNMTTDERIDKLTLTVSGLADTVSNLAAAIAEAEQRSIAASIAAEQRATERARDMQTEIVRGIEAFARGNFSRMHRLETSDTAALEERVLYLETRRPPQ